MKLLPARALDHRADQPAPHHMRSSRRAPGASPGRGPSVQLHRPGIQIESPSSSPPTSRPSSTGTVPNTIIYIELRQRLDLVGCIFNSRASILHGLTVAPLPVNEDQAPELHGVGRYGQAHRGRSGRCLVANSRYLRLCREQFLLLLPYRYEPLRERSRGCLGRQSTAKAPYGRPRIKSTPPEPLPNRLQRRHLRG